MIFDYLAQEFETNKLFEKEENNEVILTNDIDKAHIFNLIEGSRFLTKHPNRFMLKTTIRIKQEKEKV